MLLLKRRELLAAIAGAPLVLLAKPLLGKTQPPALTTAETFRCDIRGPVWATSEKLLRRVDWIAGEAAKALAATIRPIFQSSSGSTILPIPTTDALLRGDTVVVAFYGEDRSRDFHIRVDLDHQMIEHRGNPDVWGNSDGTFKIVNSEKLFGDDAYALEIVEHMTGKLATRIFVAADINRIPRPDKTGTRGQWPIVFAWAPLPLPGTGAIGACRAVDNVTARAVVSFNPSTLGQVLSIDTTFGLISWPPYPYRWFGGVLPQSSGS